MFNQAKVWSVLGLLIVAAMVVTACQATPTAAPTAVPPTEVPPTEAPPEEEAASIAEIVVASANADEPEFTTLLAAVQAAGLADTLAGEGSFTVFAPTDEAFAALPEGLLDELLADPEGALTDILLYHVAGETLMAADVVGLDSLTPLQGQEISVKVDNGSVMLNDTVMVIATDIEASNGVVHVIDAVLVPAQEEMGMEEMPSIAEIVVASASADEPEFTTLLAAVDAAGLVDTLAGEGSFTVFAPTDEAFAALPEGLIDELLADPGGALTDVLLYHVVGDKLMASDVVASDAATTLQGQDISIKVDNGNVMLNDTVMVIATDVEASNGVVHVIDAVLVPAQ